MPENGFVKNMKWKAIAGIIALFAIWVIGKALGFPVIFRWFYSGYAIVMFLFFVLLDAPAMKRRKMAGLSIFVTFIIGSAVYILMGIAAPQYDPKIEMAKIKKLTIERIQAKDVEDPQELINTGIEVVGLYECKNCHTIGGQGATKTRGPELGDAGWESEQYIKESILNPRVWVDDEFDKPKLRDAMPDFFHEDFTKGEFNALLSYIKSLKPVTEKMPRNWWTDMRIILEGKSMFDGVTNPSVNCAACHGRDGHPVMSNARNLSDANANGSQKTTDSRRRPLKEWPDSNFFEAVSKGVPETPMLGWEVFLSEGERWKVLAYAATFSGVRGVTQNDIKTYLETERGKILTSYREREEERAKDLEDLEGGIQD